MKIENESTFRAALLDGFNLFTGAGFSVLASDAEGKLLPAGYALKEELAAYFEVEGGEALGLPQLCTIIGFDRQKELNYYLSSRFNVASYDRRYEVLQDLRVETLFTTNIDNLLNKIFENCEKRFVNDVNRQGPSRNEKNVVDLFSLHGSVLDPNRPMRFSVPDISSSFQTDRDQYYYLSDRLQRFPTLVWGNGLNDSGTLQALYSLKSFDKHQEKWITVWRDPSSEPSLGAQQFFKAMGFNIIETTTDELLDYMVALVREEVSRDGDSGAQRSTSQLFPDNCLPDPATVPSQSVLEFFLGLPPRWSDVFHGNILKTTHFFSAKNSINSGVNLALIGIPACGKTTLLMQLAYEFSLQRKRHVLTFDSLSKEKAIYVAGRLRDESALIFVDNFTDSIEGFNYLAAQSNVQLVGAAAYHNFSMVRNAFRSEKQLSVSEISELPNSDIQKLLAKIPQNIRSSSFRQKPGGNSLFEIIEQNIMEPTLKQRFSDSISKLRRDDEALLDLLIMFSYVDHNRTPTSMDMLYAYLRDTTNDYAEMYKLVGRFGKLVREFWGGDLIQGEDQDVFSMRSSLVSGAILNISRGSELRRMLVQFHRNISPLRIFRYDVFKRYAYDAALIERAFEKWEEGKEFYEQLYSRDDSPFLLQQCALYLSRKGQHREAFEMIDEAIIKSGGRVWSIKNSHALIGFRANLPLASDTDARNELVKSLEQLALGFESDFRKPSNAHIFAEQVLIYADITHDETVDVFLEKANGWLSEEVRNSPWDRKSKHLLQQVRGAIELRRLES
ncbi:MAG: SIR2 family protein [Acidobacteria bacterium]|nr:SIR2 family protein [Acidobacteriota bacterium]